MRRARRDAAGWTIAEAVAALALIALVLTASFGVLVRARSADRRVDEALLRARLADAILEETLAQPFDALADRRLAIAPERAGNRNGWEAAVRVHVIAPGLKSVRVELSGAGKSTTLATRVGAP